MDCYNCGDFGHLAHQCPKPNKDKYKKTYKDKKDDSSDDDDEKKRNKPYKKKDGNKKEFHKKKKNSRAYIIGYWLTDNESSSGLFDGESENEKVVALVIGSSLSSSTPPSSSSTHLCLMAKGERKLLSNELHGATNNVAKIDIATSCDDLIVGSIEQGSSSKDKKVVESDNYDDYVKLNNENKKLKKDLEKLSTTNTIVIENLDNDYDMALENEILREENKRLKMEKNHELTEENMKLKLKKEHLKTGLSRFTRGQYLQSELLMNIMIRWIEVVLGSC
ncbi:uncharacterized protein [Miscanthus floridulus]|uniref:uncharacterized protein n=1 Tax=Miscanthus floridulus TaxID=154761 RepID=UPI00345834E0